jgi:hypothetical protein
MRRPVKVNVDPRARRSQDVEIGPRPQVARGNPGFFDAKTIDQLIAEQGVSPVTNLELLAGGLPDADIDAMIDEIYRDR